MRLLHIARDVSACPLFSSETTAMQLGAEKIWLCRGSFSFYQCIQQPFINARLHKAFLFYGKLTLVLVRESGVPGLGKTFMWTTTALAVTGFCRFHDQVHPPACHGTSSEGQWERWQPRGKMLPLKESCRLALLWITSEIRLRGGEGYVQSETQAMQTGNCRAERRFEILISLVFMLVPNKVTPFSLSSFASIATKSISAPHRRPQQWFLP